MLHKHEIGVCMDDDVAYLLEQKFDEPHITIIHADETDQRPKTRTKSRKQAFIKRIFEMIRDFDKVSICGPAAVKSEFRKLFRDNSREVLIKESDGEDITDNDKFEFINRYFSAR